jgi:hypothetical protein
MGTSSVVAVTLYWNRVAKEVVMTKVKVKRNNGAQDPQALEAAMADEEQLPGLNKIGPSVPKLPARKQSVEQRATSSQFAGLEQLYQMYNDVNRRYVAAKRAYEWQHGDVVLKREGKNEEERRANVATNEGLREFRRAYDEATLERSEAANAVALERAKLGLARSMSMADALGWETVD